MTERQISSSTLVLGGARSGKSAFAEQLAIESNLTPVYLATGQAFDSEMEKRIAKHQIDRGTHWHTIEEPIELLETLQTESRHDRVILVDCLTLWVSNLMMSDKNLETEFRSLSASVSTLKGPIIFVSNEVGQGIVPDNAMAREFRDYAGRLHQLIASTVESVYFVTAGLSQKLK
ncbi:MAG: bifunctional adenosylcobinamide kinase/adenosylcobinamide-phosphate guanylyltransferase [Sneathiella sp.]|nr:bifunctional adenosylcobinamide kinase/adenosylcobinamide-phosphate guanylyltransferase [Sneathiella sp.]